MERTAILITAVVSLALTGILGFGLIPWLQRLKYGQTINKIGPTWHKLKEGTPTMGGIMMVVGMLTALAVGYITLLLEVPQFTGEQYHAENVRFFSAIFSAVGFGAVGFVDDYLKVVHRRNLGLTATSKIIPQVAVAALYVYAMYRWGGVGTAVNLPFFGTLEMGVWYFPFAIVACVGFVNAVNLTDGIDGLATTVTFIVSVCFIVISTLLGYVGTGLVATATAGACVGFIIWNFYPARVFMGDTGSMFLGGSVVAMAFGVSFPTLLFLAGIIYLIEAFSVIIQVCYFKLTHGKRLFKMTPIHHSFEMSGFSEVGIVLLFGFITLLGCAAAVAAAITL